MKRRQARGMTLIELMVALVLGLILALAIFGILATFEGRRRTQGAGADLEQFGATAMFNIDRWVRSAGSGFAQAHAYAFGCPLYASKANNRILPRASSLPAPFNNVNPGTNGVFRLAPALILPPSHSGQTSDALVLMSARASNGNVPTYFSALAAADQLNLVNSVAFGANDLVLLANQQMAPSGNIFPCLLTQAAASVTSGTATAMPLAGTWYAASVDATSVTSFSDSGVAINLGNPALTLPPSFELIGVGNNNTLYSYDLLQTSGTPLRARAEGVFELHALYGVDTDDDGKVNLWAPATSGNYTVAALMDGTPYAANLLRTIKAVRVGLIMRTALPEKEPIKADITLKLFSDLGASLTFTRTLSTTEQYYRYRTVEATIPLRNNLL